MSCRLVLQFATRSATLFANGASYSARSSVPHTRCFATSGLPDSIKRVGIAAAYPNEYPGQNYKFNWALNFDGVTPLKKSSFRITRPLDLKVAGLEPFKTTPLKVDSESAKASMPEAGSEDLPFEAFDEVTQRTKDLLSLSEHLYCPEGHVPGTRIGVRIITNSATLSPKLLAYLERSPRREPRGQSITAYVLEGTEESFAGFAIEEIDKANFVGYAVEEEDKNAEVMSVASLVIVGKAPSIETIAAGLELSAIGILEDRAARQENTANAPPKKEDDEEE